MGAFDGLGCPVRIWPTPVEIADPIPFDQDEIHRSYDPEYLNWPPRSTDDCSDEPVAAISDPTIG